jgi:cell division cycle 2-like protein
MCRGYNKLRSRFPYLTESGLDLLSKLLTFDPKQRITAEEALRHPYFVERPPPLDPSMFPTFPSKGAGEKKKVYLSPSAPHASKAEEVMDEDKLRAALKAYKGSEASGFRLKY